MGATEEDSVFRKPVPKLDFVPKKSWAWVDTLARF
jgi:hypothetical protein